MGIGTGRTHYQPVYTPVYTDRIWLIHKRFTAEMKISQNHKYSGSGTAVFIVCSQSNPMVELEADPRGSP